jgi:hypothetical protein
MVAEAAKILAGEMPEASQEIAFDLKHRRHLVTRLRRYPKCRFGHEVVRTILNVERPFKDAKASDVLRLIENEVSHLECRRGMEAREGFAPSRLLSRQWLADQPNRLLREIGFEERDLLRVRTSQGSVFVRWTS